MLLERIARTVLVTVVSSLLLTAQSSAEELQLIDVPAGDLTLALERLAKDTNINLLYQPAQMRGLKTLGVSGNLTPTNAVLQLLQGTALRLTIDEATGAMMISGADASTSATNASELPSANPPGDGRQGLQQQRARRGRGHRLQAVTR